MGWIIIYVKRFFGKKARIIGIDLDPSAKELEKFGFEIFIGDQSSKKFWDDFFSNVGSIDILLDDGGHTNEHQILTLNYVLDNINNGGIIIVEDVICSYQKKFDNPSKYSFINYSKFLIDDLNGRYVDNIKKGVTTHPPKGVNKQKSLNKSVYSIKFYTNFVVFFIDRKKCIDTDFIFNKKKWKVEDNLIKVQNQNLRWSSHIYSNQILENKVIKRLGKIFFFLKDNFFVNTILRKITVKIRQNKIKSFSNSKNILNYYYNSFKEHQF